jgi:PRTRC genetic system protein E
METNFFTQISTYLNGVDININLTKIDGEITLAILPKPKCDEKSKKAIRPLTITSTPDKLDNAFFDAVDKPLEKTKTWSKSMSSFEADMAKAEAESQRAREQKKEKDALEKKVEGKVTKATELLDTDPRKALTIIKDGLKISPESTKLKDLEQQANQKLGMGADLFSQAPTEETESSTITADTDGN